MGKQFVKSNKRGFERNTNKSVPKVEEVNADVLKKLSSEKLHILRNIFEQIYIDNFFDKFRMLKNEMERRELKLLHKNLDRKLDEKIKKQIDNDKLIMDNRLLKAEITNLKEAIESYETDILKPYPNEHSARLTSPGKYTRFARKNNAFGTGIHAIYGIKEGKSELQAIRFDSSDFTVAEAKKWCKDHDYEPILFEPAVKKVEYECECLDCGYKLKTDKHCRSIDCPECGGEMRRVERPGPGQKMRKEEGEEIEKRAVPYKKFPLADDVAWSFSSADGNKILGDEENPDWEKYKSVHAWFDSENPEIRASYKLPHHKVIDGEIKTVRRGVIAAMGALLGARGGTKIPDADRKAVYEHLKRHYKELDLEPPELHKLEKMEFGEDYDIDIEVDFIKTNKDEQIVTGVVYSPNEVDAQGDEMDSDEVRKAAYDYMLYSQNFKIMHKEKTVAKVIESFIAPVDYNVGGEKVKKGSWVMAVKILAKELWKKIKDGEINGFSIGGRAKIRQE